MPNDGGCQKMAGGEPKSNQGWPRSVILPPAISTAVSTSVSVPGQCDRAEWDKLAAPC